MGEWLTSNKSWIFFCQQISEFVNDNHDSCLQILSCFKHVFCDVQTQNHNLFLCACPHSLTTQRCKAQGTIPQAKLLLLAFLFNFHQSSQFLAKVFFTIPASFQSTRQRGSPNSRLIFMLTKFTKMTIPLSGNSWCPQNTYRQNIHPTTNKPHIAEMFVQNLSKTTTRKANLHKNKNIGRKVHTHTKQTSTRTHKPCNPHKPQRRTASLSI